MPISGRVLMSLSKNYFFSSHELSWRSRHGEWVNITPKRIRVNHSIVAFSSWSMLYQHTRHRNSNKFKTVCQKLASVFVLSVAQTRNCRRNYQIFTSSRKTLKMTLFHRYVLHFKNYLFLMKNYCTMPYKNLRFWHLIT